MGWDGFGVFVGMGVLVYSNSCGLVGVRVSEGGGVEEIVGTNVIKTSVGVEVIGRTVFGLAEQDIVKRNIARLMVTRIYLVELVV